MNQSGVKYIFLALYFAFSCFVLNGQLHAQSVANMGIKLGGAKLLGEIPSDFSGLINEFDNKAGFSSSIELSKYLTQKCEIGAEISYSKIKGSTQTSEFSAEGIQQGIPSVITDPTEYQNMLFSQSAFFRYYFVPASSKSVIIPFVRTGVGILNYYSQFKYIGSSNDDLLFGKGSEGYGKLSTPLFVLGTGLKSYISPELYLISSVDFNMVNYDFLDVVHNYNTEKQRMKIIGLFTEFKVGIFYTIKKSENKNGQKGKRKGGKSSTYDHLPFAR